MDTKTNTLRWIVVAVDCVVMVLSMVVVVLGSIDATAEAIASHDVNASAAMKPYFEGDGKFEPLTKSIKLKEWTNPEKSVPVANINITSQDLNEFFGVPSDVMLSPLMYNIGRCRMAVNYERAMNVNQGNPHECNYGVYARWATWAIALAMISWWEAMLGVMSGKYTYVHPFPTNDCGIILWRITGAICIVLWITTIVMYTDRDWRIGLWYVPNNSVRMIPYYYEPAAWRAILALVITGLLLKLIGYVIWFLFTVAVEVMAMSDSSLPLSRKEGMISPN